MWGHRILVLPLGALLLAGCARQATTPEPALRVERVTPAVGERLFLNGAIRVEFNTEIDPLSVTPSTLRVVDERGNTVPGARRIGARSVTFEPVPPRLADLSDGTFQANRVYRLQVSGFPLAHAVRSPSGRVLQEGFTREFRTVDLQPQGYPSPLLPVGLGIEPFRVRSEGPLSRQIAAGSGRVQIQFSLPVLPTSLSRLGFEVMILRFNPDQRDGDPERFFPQEVRVLSLPQPIDPYPGSTVELVLGDDVDLVEGDLVAVQLTGGAHALRDYRGRELQSVPEPFIPAFTVAAGDRIPLASWPDGEESFETPRWGLPSFGVGPNGIQPQVCVEAGAGSLGEFRPVRDTVLRPGVPFDRGDGEMVRSQGGLFDFVVVDIPAGVTVRIVAEDSVRILSCGSIRIAGSLELETSVSSAQYSMVFQVENEELLRQSAVSLLAGDQIVVTGDILFQGEGDPRGSPLTIVAGTRIDLRGGALPARTVLANPTYGRVTGATGSGSLVQLVTSITAGPPLGVSMDLEAWSSWRAVPASHMGPVHVQIEPGLPLTGLEVLVQSAPPDSVDPSHPDTRSQFLEQPRPLPADGELDVPPGGFVRFLLRAHVVGGQPLPALRRIQLHGN
jgi:hypothetical protein